jgi:CBS domain-containing membrane protein
LRELSESNGTIAQALSRPAIADAGDPALSLLPVLTDGRTHAVIVVDADRQILGLISQTDLLSAMARLLPNKNAASVSVA